MQRTFARGEIGPTLYGGADGNVYNAALATCQNFEILRHGGAANRPGFRWCAEVKDSTTRTWLLKFVFSDTDTYVIEAGQHYFRFYQLGGQVVVSPSAWSSLTAYVVGNLVAKSGVNYYCILGNTNFSPPNATYWYPLTGAILEIPTPYAAADIPMLKYVQAGDIVTLTHPSYVPMELQRTAQGWVLVTISTAPAILPPGGLAAISSGFNITFNTNPANNDTINIGVEPYTFKTTLTGASFEVHIGLTAAATATNLQEAIVAGPNAGTDYGTGTVANPGATATVSGNIVTVTATMTTGIAVFKSSAALVLGPQQSSYVVTAFLPTTFEESVACAAVTIPSNVPTTSTPNLLTWSAVAGALGYNVYLDSTGNGLYGFIGTTPNLAFNDIGYQPDASVTPPLANVIFNSTNNYPSTPGFYQQRRVFGNTNTQPEGVWCSRTGAFYNFTYSEPIQDDDAVIFGIAGRRVNTVRHLIDVGTLIVLTRTGEFAILGDTDGTLKPTAINARQQSYYGANDVIPAIVGKAIVYVQARGSIVRDLKFDYQQGGYDGRDLTIYSPHFFEGHSIVRLDYAQLPQSIVWCVRDDGLLLGLTYISELEVFGWHQHVTTNGVFEDVCTIPESTAPATPWATYQDIEEDAVYVIVNRKINGVTRRYVERLCSRVFSDYRLDAYFLDSMLTYNGINTGATTVTLSTGGGWTPTDLITVTASVSSFSAYSLGDGVTVWLPEVLDSLGNVVTPGMTVRITITNLTSGTVVQGNPNANIPIGLQGVATTAWSHAVSVVGGLTYLEGQTVGVLANGVPSTAVVSNTGTVTVSTGIADVIHVGLPITATLQTLDLDSAQQDVRDKQKLVNDISVVVEQSRGFYAGPDTAHLLPFPIPANTLGTDVFSSNGGAVLTQTLEGNILAAWQVSGRIVIQQRDPLPLAVLGIIRNGPLGG